MYDHKRVVDVAADSWRHLDLLARKPSRDLPPLNSSISTSTVCKLHISLLPPQLHPDGCRRQLRHRGGDNFRRRRGSARHMWPLRPSLVQTPHPPPPSATPNQLHILSKYIPSDAEDNLSTDLGIRGRGEGVRDSCGHLGLLELKFPVAPPPLQLHFGLLPL